MRRIFALVGLLLLSMGRCRVSAEAAAKACEVVRSGSTSRNAAAAAYGVNKTSLSRRLSDLTERVRQLCNDGRPIPWTPDKGPGRSWLEGFLGRHERISLRLARIYESNGVTSAEDERLHNKFYDFWG
ncbi:unnamed protein product [Ectocarpus sp. CCAP 1310/34]|nr:unnamed protein product [Ectocarpus sp. CCAP 1310/34]